MGYHKWTKMVLSTWRDGRWAIQSMLWVNKVVEAEQVPVDSPDITAAIIQLLDCAVLVISVYILCTDAVALKDTCENIHKVVARARRGTGTTVDVVIVGDFNRYD